MYAIEFKAVIKDGKIELPEVYRERFKSMVRVIVLEEAQRGASTLIDELLENPLKIEDFTPLSREESHARR